MTIHPTAVIHKEAEVGKGTRIGPYAVIGNRVRLGEQCEIGSHVVVDGDTRIGDRCRLFPFVSIGMEPQDLKYRGEPTRIEIGDGNKFREYVTVHLGTAGGGGITKVGNDNLIMAYSHIAHDCLVGNSTVLANGATLAGHVQVEDFATIGAFSGLHQFCRVGRYAYIGGYSVVTKDALPYVLTVGNRARIFGINVIGLRRRNFSPATVKILQDSYRTLFQKKIPFRRALETVERKYGREADVAYLLEFIQTSSRGIAR